MFNRRSRHTMQPPIGNHAPDLGSDPATLMGDHSRRVRLLKVALPLIALCMVGLLAAWPSMRDSGHGTTIIDRGRTEVVNARFFGRDRENRPYSISSAAAMEVLGDDSLIDLMRPVTEFTQSGGTWVTMRSDEGRYNKESGMLYLFGNVHVLRDDGMEFATRTAMIDTEAGTAWGDERTIGQGPSGEIRAEGFRLYDNGETVTFVNASTAKVAAQSATGTR